MKLLAEIQKQTAGVLAKYLIIEGDIRPGERVLGKLPEDLLQLYGLHLQMLDEIESLKQKHFSEHVKESASEKDCDEFHDQLRWKKEQHQALIRFFWVAARYEFGVLTGEIGVRAHGQVVTWTDDPVPEVASAETEAPKANSRRGCTGARVRLRPNEQ